jgi:hypothetical protein
MSTRVTQYRTEIKRDALRHVPMDYRLTYGDADQIDGLLLSSAYIYPRDPETVRSDLLYCFRVQNDSIG